MLAALFGVSLLVIDYGFEIISKPDNQISEVIARIVFVGINLTGASFAASQYTKQKNLADDYAYIYY